LEYTKSTEYTKENRYLLRLNTFFSSEKLSSTYKPVFVKSLISISDYDEQNLHRLIGYKWIKRHNDKLKVDLNFIAIRSSVFLRICYISNLYISNLYEILLLFALENLKRIIQILFIAVQWIGVF
jgi:hypothetical protein